MGEDVAPVAGAAQAGDAALLIKKIYGCTG